MGLTLTSRAPTSPIDAHVVKSSYAAGSFSGTIAATGTVPIVYVLATVDATRTAGTVKAMSVNIEPATYEAYAVIGAEVCVYAGAAALTGSMHGLFVESQGFSTSIGGDWYSLYVYSAPGAAPSGSSAVARFDHNSAVATDAFVIFNNGSTCPSALFSVGSNATDTAWGYTGTASTQSGWLLVKVGTNTRYIALYTTQS